MKKIILITALLVASSVAARAEFYVGASVTSSSTDDDPSIEDFDNSATGWKAYVGWNFAKFLGAEAGYRQLGEVGGSTDTGEGIIEQSYDIGVIDVSARAFLPIGKLFNIYAKVGYADVQVDAEGYESGSDDEWEVFYGIGSEFNIGKNFAIRAEWEMFDTDYDLNTLSAGLVFRF